MKIIYSLLFPKSLDKEKGLSLLLLGLRVAFGLLLMAHGIQKLSNYEALANGGFPDPLGMGSRLSVSLAIFGELFCPMALIAGLLLRLSMLPIITTMLVAFVFAHNGSVTEGELALAYLLVFIFIYLAGAGRYSMDYAIAKHLSARKK